MATKLILSDWWFPDNMFGRSNATFDRLLEKATSQLLLEPDWTSIMMICDSIRQGDTNPKYAVTAIKKKFYHANPQFWLFESKSASLKFDPNWIFELFLVHFGSFQSHVGLGIFFLLHYTSFFNAVYWRTGCQLIMWSAVGKPTYANVIVIPLGEYNRSITQFKRYSLESNLLLDFITD